jgi:hypothetical protein
VKVNRINQLIVTAAVAWLFSAWPIAAPAAAKGEQLRRTMAQIALLNGQLAERKADAAQMQVDLAARVDALWNEIRKQVRAKGIETEKEALKSSGILFDLRLIAEMEAYKQRYARKVNYYRVACDRLSYLYQQADDDLKIVNTLSGMKIDALITQSQKVLNDYLPHAQTLVIQPETMRVASPERIWKGFKAAK